MYFKCLLFLIAAIATSAYAYRIPSAEITNNEIDPRLFDFLQDLYSQVIHPPLNHVVTNLALLGAQVLAGISQTGLPTPGKRSPINTDADLRNFFDNLWNTVIRPPLQDAIQSASLMAAQVLAGVGVNGVDLNSMFGKRDVTEVDARFIESLGNALNSVFANVLQKPLEQALSSLALMGAQVLAGVGVNGVDLNSMFGKRDVTEVDARFIESLGNALNSVFANVLQKPLEQALSSLALMGAQVLAGVGVNGVDLNSMFGKRDVTEVDARFIESLGNALNSVFANVLQKPLEQALSSLALMGAQVLAGVGVNGVDLNSMFGKRDVTEVDARFIESLGNALNSVFANVLQKPLEQALSSLALMGAQVLAGVGVNGVDLNSMFGKRDVTEVDARFIESLGNALNSVFANVLQKPLEQALSSLALMGAQVLAGVGVNGVDLNSMFGKRDVTEVDARFIESLGNALNSVFANVLQKPLEQALSSLALMGAQVLAGVGVNGVDLNSMFGKRDVTEVDARFIESLGNALNSVFANVLQKPLEQALSSLALMGAQVLAGVGVNGVDLNSMFGKRDVTEVDARFIESLGNALNSVFANVLQKPLEQALSSLALMGAQVLAGVGVNGVDLNSMFGKRDVTEVDARFIESLGNALNSVFANVLQKPLEQALSSLALMGAQVLAGVGVNGVDLNSMFGKRDVTEVDARFIESLGNALNSVFANVLQKPLEQALSSLALMGAQVLAGVGVNGVDLNSMFGKRDVTEVDARFIESLGNALNSVFANVLQKPLEQALSSLALMGAQVLAGVGVNGVDLNSMFGKRDVTEVDARFIESLGNALNSVFANVLQKPLEQALSSLALMGAQVLAGVGVNGVDLNSMFGKRDVTEVDARFIESLGNALNSVFANVLQKPLEQALSSLALMGAQVLAGVGVNGVDLNSMFGKRDVTEVDARFIESLGNALNSVFANVLQKPLEQALSSLALMGAQVLAGVGVNGVDLNSMFGKRDVTEVDARFIESLGNALNSVFANVLQKPLEQALSSLALMGAQVLAGVGVNGVDLNSMFGKRDVTEVDARFIESLGNALNSVFANVLQKPLEQALSSLALMGAQVLAGVGVNGVDLNSMFGKRDVTEVDARFIESLGNALNSVFANVLQKPLEQALSSLALMGAQVLAGVGVNGVDLNAMFGRREMSAGERGAFIDDIVDHALGLYSTQLKPAIENALGAAALHLAGVLANFSQNGFGRR